MSSALRTRRYAGSNPVRKANHQRVGESGRPYLPWKQGIVCSNHTTLTIFASIQDVRGSNPREADNIDPWRNRNASVCKTVMSRGSTGRVIQDRYPLPTARPLGEELLLITANRTVRNRYERPSISDLVYQLGRLFVEQENTGQHRGSGPVFGVSSSGRALAIVDFC
jgi:hypothetical protein